MDFNCLLKVLNGETIFTTGLILAGQSNPGTVRRQLGRWIQSGRVSQLRRGVYVLAPPYAASAPHPFRVSNLLGKSSYVSLQSALAYYGIIPEYVPVTTAVTPGRPGEFETSSGRFLFRHVRSSSFFGFAETEVSRGQSALLASPAKALTDLLYLTPGSDDEGFLQELRLEPSRLPARAELNRTAESLGSYKVKRCLQILVASGLVRKKR
ncbi:MAG: hypothetical protein NTZ01_02820 [Verrucomicrobia bacterium]|nr:hypothetical protein [Verrucomicrobiota bacterium]